MQAAKAHFARGPRRRRRQCIGTRRREGRGRGRFETYEWAGFVKYDIAVYSP